MKKALALLLILLLTTPLFAGGGQETAAEEAKYKIGIAFDVGGRGDQSFNDSAYNGLVMLAREFQGYIKDDPDRVDSGRNIEMKYMQTQSGGQDRETLLRLLAEEGYDLIIGVGFLYSDSLAKVAQDFPDVHFGLVDGYIPDLTESSNITCLSFAEHEGSFLLGAIAGLKNQGGKVGFVGGMDIPLIHKFHGGFFAGAMFVNPELRRPGMLMGQYCGKDPNAFNDPKTAESIAANMYRQGATIVYHAAGASGSGVFKAAKDLQKTAMGVDSDQGLILASASDAESQAMAGHILTSMLKRVDIAVYLTGKELIETGRNTGGYRTFGLADDGVGYAVNQYNEAKLADIKDQIEALKARVISGEITVPDDDAKVAEWARTAF